LHYIAASPTASFREKWGDFTGSSPKNRPKLSKMGQTMRRRHWEGPVAYAAPAVPQTRTIPPIVSHRHAAGRAEPSLY
jgi:hypothetical protein